MDNFLVSQVLAGVAFGFGMCSFQFGVRRHILWCWSASAFFNALHFLVLGQITAGVLILTTCVRFMTASFTTDRRLMYLFIVILLAGFAITFRSPVSLLAVGAALLGTWGAFQSDDRRIRIALVLCSTSWIVHNTLIGSPVAALMETAFLLSNLVGWWRFYSFGWQRRK
ncbi:MAG TPA: YgjV family protein [Gammaproteobacteria bacterium]|nr:YgjV family protein [Gammaproteobacteria bacterium]